MTISEPRLRSLLRQAKRVGQAKKRAAAKELYTQITAEAPESVEGWRGLAELSTDPTEKEAAYQKILTLEPENGIAQAALHGEAIPSLFIIEKPPKPDPKPEPEPKPTAQQKEFDLFCYRHPDTGTSLRCYDCNQPICIKCAKKTPVGYICPVCERKLEDKYFTAKPTDYIIALAVSLPLSVIVGVAAIWFSSFGFIALLLMTFVAGGVGNLIGKAVKIAVGKRRGRYLPHLVATMVGLGAVLGFPFFLFTGQILSMVALGMYIFIAGGAAFYWTK